MSTRQIGNVPQLKNETIRESEAYRQLSAYDAVAFAEGFEEGSAEQQLAAWQYLHDSGMAYTLQGWFGRQAQSMIQEGLIDG